MNYANVAYDWLI